MWWEAARSYERSGVADGPTYLAAGVAAPPKVTGQCRPRDQGADLVAFEFRAPDGYVPNPGHLFGLTMRRGIRSGSLAAGSLAAGSFSGNERLEMLRLRAGSRIGILALGFALALSPIAVTAASASTHKGTTHHKAKPRHKKKGSSSSTVSATCPTAAEIAPAAGTTYPAPQVETASGTTICNYNDANSGANLVLEFAPSGGTSAGVLKSVASSQASAQHVTASPVSGLGNAAYIFTLNDASTNSSGVATVSLEILDGSKLIDITAEATVAQTEAVAHYVLSH